MLTRMSLVGCGLGCSFLYSSQTRCTGPSLCLAILSIGVLPSIAAPLPNSYRGAYSIGSKAATYTHSKKHNSFWLADQGGVNVSVAISYDPWLACVFYFFAAPNFWHALATLKMLSFNLLCVVPLCLKF